MNAAGKTQTYQQAALAGFSPVAKDPQWLAALRQKAYERFKSLGFPTRKHEAWKYLYLDSILNTSFSKNTKTSSEGAEKKLSGFKNEMRLVFVNGSLDPDLCFLSTDWLGLIENNLTEKSTGFAPAIEKQLAEETNPFALINTFEFQEGVFLKMPAGVNLPQPLHVIFLSSGQNENSPVYHSRVNIELEPGAQLDVVLHHLDLNSERYFMNSLVEFSLGRDSKLSCMNRQQPGPQAIQFLNTRVRQESGSQFEKVTYVSGGSIVRDDADVQFMGENAFCSVSGLSLMSGNSQVFHHVNVSHRFPHCTSRQNFKNILAGKSIAEFNSMVHVHRDARKSDSEQMDKNMLLSENARIYSRPQLKIDNDDVRANHGAATGRLDKNELFYLRSRGLDMETARFLLIDGFAQEILEQFRPELLRKELEVDAENQIRTVMKEAGER